MSEDRGFRAVRTPAFEEPQRGTIRVSLYVLAFVRLGLLLTVVAAMLTMCACTPPLDQVLQLWDFLLAFGVHLNVLCVIAQLLLMRDEVMTSTRYTPLFGERGSGLIWHVPVPCGCSERSPRWTHFPSSELRLPLSATYRRNCTTNSYGTRGTQQESLHLHSILSHHSHFHMIICH
jgi:hypothetical protein